jgi:hypothetical protein
MPRTCTVCTHPERAAIDKALVAGAAPSGVLLLEAHAMLATVSDVPHSQHALLNA